jgi:hypothetical protein
MLLAGGAGSLGSDPFMSEAYNSSVASFAAIEGVVVVSC